MALLAGLSAAAGYQIIARAQRPPPYFRGPSPLICFGIIFLLVGLLGTVLVGSSAESTISGPLFVLSTLVTVAGYVFVVWVYGFRSGALNLKRSASRSARPWARSRATSRSVRASCSWSRSQTACGARSWQRCSARPRHRSSRRRRPALDTLYVVVGACLLVPIGEELFFRGYSLTAWWQDLGERSALIRSTLFFAFVHIINILTVQSQQGALDGAKQALFEVLVIAPVGLALGWLFIRRGLLASIAGHAAFNAFAVLSLLIVSSR